MRLEPFQIVAILASTIATLLVAQRPDVLATYSDRLYLPARGAPR